MSAPRWFDFDNGDALARGLPRSLGVPPWLCRCVCASLLLASISGCSSNRSAEDPTAFDMTYFDRQEAEQKAKRAAVVSAGLWADEDATGRRIGVILPLQGASRRAGDSVLAGMMAGYWADDPEQRARLTFYTEEQYGSLARAYATALDNGAEVIVGPLQKDAVQRMVETTIIAKPTIALNTTKSPGWQERNLYQFSLAIEEEAINAARALYASGYRRVFLLYEDNDVGNRAMRAFSSEMLRQDGRIADTLVFGADALSYDVQAQQIADATHRVKVFSLNPQEQRYQVFRDGDAVFVAGEREGIAGMTRALRAAGIAELPIVTTSHGDSLDPALNDVYMVDMPWMVDAQMRTEVWGRTPVDFQGEARRLDERLFAMGMDGYRLARNIQWMGQNRDRRLDGVTGVMTIDGAGRVERTLVLATREGSKMRVVTLPQVTPNQSQPIGEIIVRDGVESAVAVGAPSPWGFQLRNPFSKS